MQIHLNDLYKQKRSPRVELGAVHRDEGRYTLDMVNIDNKIREVINHIKQEEAKIANLAK